MIIAHAGIAPRIDPAAWVAPDATICGDVETAAGSRVLHGARIVGEAGGKIRIGRSVIVMENAVVRAGPRHPAPPLRNKCSSRPGFRSSTAR